MINRYIYVLLLLLMFCVCQDKHICNISISHIRTEKWEKHSSEIYYEIKNFKGKDACFRSLFNFIKRVEEEGEIIMVTNAYAVYFDDGHANFNYTWTKVFFFDRQNSGFRFVLLRPIVDLKKMSFVKNILTTETTFKGDFDELNINIFQSFINAVEEEEKNKRNCMHIKDVSPKKHSTGECSHIYELYNKDNIKKVEMRYYGEGEELDNGKLYVGKKWFEIDVL